ncbi:MAG TPA: glycosyltransferase [Anaerolineae bacterium]|nr:glycosyltransferase [Anaerolineae bacterium]
MRIVLLTHVFPRAADDPLGAFLLHLTRGMGERAQVLVVAPHAAGLLEHETFGDIRVTRFHYAPDAQETLAYTGVMHEQVARGIGGKFAFARFVWAYLRAALYAVREFKPQVIHAHWWLPGGFVGALVSRLTSTPLVITTHGTDVEQLRRAGWTKPLARFTFGRASIITCGSNYLREQVLELGVADPARVVVRPMPVNPLFDGGRRTDDEHELSPVLRPPSFVVLTVSRLTKQKSVDTIIDALALVRAKGIDARLRIVGEGDQRGVLEEKIRKAGLEAYVEFLGMRPQIELPQLYADCDAFVLSSVREGMGLVIAEALLCGAPVIATNSGGIPDMVRDGETGLVFPERDANALAAALEKYARDPAFAAQLAANGRALVQARYTPARAADEFLKIYERASRRP